MINEIYGAKALVYLKYDGDIEALVEKLSKSLSIPDFWIDTREESPHELIGLCENFGFEGWLETSEKVEGFAYSFKMETEDSFDEIHTGKMHDLSLWFARFIFNVCKIETFVPGSVGEEGVLFS
ncbi:hypothetical protein [Kiloniella sp.]|uniref:hypothetical protein n=1 Tax=Kiloniella sp. TaxID=1938587 RepID=UPI003B02DB80